MADVKRATPDGYTLVFGAFQQISVLPQTERVNYDPKTDFSYVSIFGEGPFVLAINSEVPAKSVTEFVSYAKSKPGAMTYASGGILSEFTSSPRCSSVRRGDLFTCLSEAALRRWRLCSAAKSSLTMAMPPN